MEQMLENLVTRLETRFDGSFSFTSSDRGWTLHHNDKETRFIIPGRLTEEVMDVHTTLTWQDVEESIFKTWEMTMEELDVL